MEATGRQKNPQKHLSPNSICLQDILILGIKNLLFVDLPCFIQNKISLYHNLLDYLTKSLMEIQGQLGLLSPWGLGWRESCFIIIIIFLLFSLLVRDEKTFSPSDLSPLFLSFLHWVQGLHAVLRK